MPRILLIKTSSLGDVIHNLPVVNDLLRGVPEAQIDWIVEAGYADLLRLHPGITRVIPVDVRRWRKSWFEAATRAQRRDFRAHLREHAYDLVLDTQGLIKSALLARTASLAPGGVIAGYALRSAREPLASLFYQRRYDIDRHSHAVERLRSLAAQACAYQPAQQPDFGLRVPPARFDWLPGMQANDAAALPYVVMLHATSRAEKSWPDADWIMLAQMLSTHRIAAVFPWGNADEQVRAQTYARQAPYACVAPRLSLTVMTSLLAQASAVVGVDTGLTHLSAALETPTVGIFGATPRWRYAPYWTPRAINLGDGGMQPKGVEVIAALREALLQRGIDLGLASAS